MPYFVTGATGFIGRPLVDLLLRREGHIHVLVREGSRKESKPGEEEPSTEALAFAHLLPGTHW